MSERTAPTQRYAIRLADLEGYRDLVPLVEGDGVAKLLALGHKGGEGDNPHIHICVEYTKAIKIDTLRARMKTVFTKGKGNGHISVKKWDGNEKALSYLFHEETSDIVHNVGYTEEDISRFQEKDREVKKAFKEGRDNSIFAHTLQVCTVNGNFNEEYIIRVYMLETHKRGKMYPGDYKMKNIVETIRGRNDLENSIHEIYIRLYHR